MVFSGKPAPETRVSPPLHDLLSEPLISITGKSGSTADLTLPGILAALGRDEVDSFASLQAHQEHAWHAFLTQLAAMALHAGGRSAGVNAEEDWRTLLSALTSGASEPWCLLVKDLSKPAFMQPPIPEGNLKAFKGPLLTPDQIDVLLTTKNHDVKMARMSRARPEHWVYALVSLQTMQGFLGPGNYGIARMNGGFASRPGIGFAPSRRAGARWMRDVSVLLARRDRVAELGTQREGGLGLLWLEPWDGTKSLPFGRLDPYFIEICRRLRLANLHGGVGCHYAPTKAARIQAKELKGVTGDPWTPVVTKDVKALTVSETGFNYRLTSALLLGGDCAPGVALEAASIDGDTVRFFASVLVRGSGKTEGLHQRELTVPTPVWKLLQNEDRRLQLAEIARARIDRVAVVANKVLKPALLTLLQAAPARLDFKDSRADPLLKRFDCAVDDTFFTALWDAAEATAEDADRRWDQQLLAFARTALERAIEATPVPAARRHRAIAGADNCFAAMTYRHLPELTAPRTEERAV
jgi:CRISPR system Cascade subunit CasA